MRRKIYLSSSDKIVGGVCGGLAEYLGTDPTLVRLIAVILTIMTSVAPGVIIYLIAWVIIPKRPFF